uniref:Putative salivary protease inhibitor n=1 Tax=Culicoides nubeculosus TaxID=144565 RepID=B9URL4_CULNU|nr:putative salivary protease inhibitor [Culicoides nubeculosus]
MLKLILFSGIFFLVFIQSGHCVRVKKNDPSLPPECKNPLKSERASICKKEGGFKYNSQTNKCFYLSRHFCPGKNGFTTMEQCIYQCYDYRKLDAREKENKNKDGCNRQINEDGMEPPIRVSSRSDDVDTLKDNRCREPNNKGLKTGGKRTKNPAFRYNKEKNACEAIMTNVCMGRNRFSSQDECIHVCVWNKSSGRFRHVVRAENAKL